MPLGARPRTQDNIDLPETVVVIHPLRHDLPGQLQQRFRIAQAQCRDDARIGAVQCPAGPLHGDEIVERRQGKRPELTVALAGCGRHLAARLQGRPAIPDQAALHQCPE